MNGICNKKRLGDGICTLAAEQIVLLRPGCLRQRTQIRDRDETDRYNAGPEGRGFIPPPLEQGLMRAFEP